MVRFVCALGVCLGLMLGACTEAAGPADGIEVVSEPILTVVTPLPALTGTRPPTAVPPTSAPATPDAMPTLTAIALSATAVGSPTPTLPATPTPRLEIARHVVRVGDSLIALGQRYGVTPEAILAANGLGLAAAMQPGRVLEIPPPLTRSAVRVESFIVVPTAPPPGPRGLEIGRSAFGLPLEVYTLGQGPKEVVFIGGIHGGFEANTILLAYEMVIFFTANPDLLPEQITLRVIPNANPDGLYKGSGKVGRFTLADIYPARYDGRTNGRGVDLNRNWKCDWKAEAVWRNEIVGGGETPYSEPETAALHDYLLALQPEAVLFWHSAANGVYVPGCPETDEASLALAETFATATGYPLYTSFGYYDVTGDAGDSLAAAGIPALTVELSSLESLDWEQNLAGVKALLEAVAQ